MAIRLNTELRNLMAGEVGTTFAGGVLDIYSGSQPSSPNTAFAGDLLVSITLPDPAFGSASSGAINKEGLWAEEVTASGTAGSFRLRNAADTHSLDGSITGTGGGGDIELDDVSLTAEAFFVLDAATLTQPQEL